MKSEPKKIILKDSITQRRDKEAAALRENLKRRKQQQRERKEREPLT